VLLYEPDVPIYSGDPIDGVTYGAAFDYPLGGYAPGEVQVDPWEAKFDAILAPNIGIDPGNGVYVAVAGKPFIYSCPGRSLANTSSALYRSTDPNDWTVTNGQPAATRNCALVMSNQPPGYTGTGHSPDGQNAGQTLTCGVIPQVCGNGIVQYGEDCEVDADCQNGIFDGFSCAPPGDFSECFCVPPASCGNDFIDPGEECDEGEDNSDAPNALCRTDCTLQRCGDDIVDPDSPFGDEYDENCELGDPNSACTGDDVCFECTCGEEPLGTLDFTVVGGQTGTDECDNAAPGSLLKTDGGPTGTIDRIVCNGTVGNFVTVGGPFVLFGGRRDGDDIASLRLDSPVVLKANLTLEKPGCNGACVACWRFEQDPDKLSVDESFVDCAGGRRATARLELNSNFSTRPGSRSAPGQAMMEPARRSCVC
jgi:hypothetical protein